MTEKIIEKNFTLSADFNEYVIKNPDAIAKLPAGACLIFEDKADNNLTKANRQLIREITEGGEKCFKAIKDGRKWTLEPAL